MIVTSKLTVLDPVQFASPSVRRFNLVGFDARCHGDTSGAVPSTFRRLHAAEDVFKFMVRSQCFITTCFFESYELFK